MKTLKLGEKMIEIEIEKPKMIRFIDSHYNHLFDLPDGGKIKLSWEDGSEEFILTCHYIDPTHFKLENVVYHICQFAERIERNKHKVEVVENA